jgi:hypothetical protein
MKSRRYMNIPRDAFFILSPSEREGVILKKMKSRTIVMINQ